MPNKTVLITGGTRGIGLAVARRLARSAYNLAISYRDNQSAAAELREELRRQKIPHEIFQADIADPQDAGTLARRVFDRFGSLDALVNNAGITDDAPFLGMEAVRYRRVLATNLFGTMRLTGAALPYLLQGQAPAIVMVASLGGIAGKEGQVAYAASKGGLIGFTQWLGRRYADRGLRVNAVAPGFIQTDMTSNLDSSMFEHVIRGTALRRLGDAAAVAEAVNFLLAHGYIQSTTLRVDGGFNR
jgi:3-oxoacyl-[acyl-carrier protein] reductase